jgi:hypothetical protein
MELHVILNLHDKWKAVAHHHNQEVDMYRSNVDRCDVARLFSYVSTSHLLNTLNASYHLVNVLIIPTACRLI